MIMSWVEGEKLSESTAADVKQLCTILLNCYLIQLLETGFLHADPHPGNLMRTPDGKLVILDFGLMTEVGTNDIAPHSTSLLLFHTVDFASSRRVC
jgi:aarF domain-containing kinase